MKKATKPKSPNRKAADRVLKVAYEILDDIIAPTVGIKGIWANLFMAEPSTYLSDKTKVASEQRKKIITKVARRYGAQEYALAHAWRQPIALFALVAMSQSGYVVSEGSGKKTRKLTAKDAWEYLDNEDRKLASERRARAKNGSR